MTHFRLANVILLTSVFTISAFGQTATVIAIEANVRERPSSNANIVFKVKQGTRLKVESEEHTNGWYYISRNKLKGWIHGNSIEIGEASSSPKQSVRHEKDNWKYYATGSEGMYYYNQGTMQRIGGVYRVWAKMVFENSYSNTGAMVQYDIRCSDSSYRTITGVKYFKNGAVDFTFQPSRFFTPAIPETVLFALVRHLC